MLKGQKLTKRYGDKILFDSVNVKLERNRTRVLFGPGGEGKNTLIRISAVLVREFMKTSPFNDREQLMITDE